VQSFAQDVEINGQVIDETGHPLIGAKVSAKGTEAVTNHNGDFTIKVPAGTKIKVKYPRHGTEVKRANQKMVVTLNEIQSVTWNVRFGLNMGALISNKDNSFDEHKLGLQMGVGMEYAFTQNWVLQPSLMLYKKTYKDTTKSANFSDDGKPCPIKWIADVYVAQLNVVGGYRFRLPNSFGLVIAAGPTFGYSLDGTLKRTLQRTAGSELTKYSIFSKKNDPDPETMDKINEFDRFNVGIMGSVTAEYDRFFLSFETAWEEHNTSAVSIGIKF